MISKDVEAKIVAAIGTAIPATAPKRDIFGVWQPSAQGFVKNGESADSVAVIFVSTSPFQRDTFTVPTGTLTGTVTLAVRTELDATGTAFVTFAQAIDDLFRAWQGATYQQSFTDLDVSGFSVADISISAAVPIVDRTSSYTSVSWTFTIRGCETASNN